MSKPVTVRDRTGAVVVRANGQVQDGDAVQASLMMTDSAGDRHGVVRAKLGAEAEGKSAAWLDGAYKVLVGQDAAASPAAGSAAPAATAKGSALDASRGAYDAMCRTMADEWKGPLRRAAEAAPVTLDRAVEDRIRDGRIKDTPVNRARAEMAQLLSDGWKEQRA